MLFRAFLCQLGDMIHSQKSLAKVSPITACEVRFLSVIYLTESKRHQFRERKRWEGEVGGLTRRLVSSVVAIKVRSVSTIFSRIVERVCPFNYIRSTLPS